MVTPTNGGTLSNASSTPGSITTNGDVYATTFNPFNTDVDTVLANPSTICTWDPLFVDGRGNNAPANLSNGFLTAASPNTGDWNIVGSVYVSRGKYYWELTIGQGNDNQMCGVLSPQYRWWTYSNTQLFIIIQTLGLILKLPLVKREMELQLEPIMVQIQLPPLVMCLDLQ